MSVKVNIFYPHLQQFTNNQDVVEVNGSTVGDCLDDMVRQYPSLKKALFDEHGQLLSYVIFFINREYAHPAELTKPVNDGDELTIALMIAGG